MRQTGFLLGIFALLLSAGTAKAQAASGSGAALENVSADVQSNPSLFASSETSPAEPLVAAAASGITVPSAVPAQQVPAVQNVFPTYKWQIYGGYTYMRLFEAPSLSQNLNGLNLSIQYYPFFNHFGVDGEFIATFGSQLHQTAKFADGLGGVRFRFAAPRGVDMWVHGLVGGAKVLPQTAFGGQTGLSYELGGGADFGSATRRWAIRAAADMVATHFFSTSQYSPKFSLGFVFKF